MQLDDKTVIITGASSGIGAAAALMFAAEGANAVLGARREALLDELAGQIVRSHGKAVSAAGDIKNEDYAAKLVNLAETEFGGLDAAFNNAGITGVMAGHDPAAHKYIAGLHSLNRMAAPEEIAQAALFLLSKQSAFVTGSAMLADGGISIKLG